MSAIVLLDTSVYLNILDVPGRNQDRKAVFDQFEHRINSQDHFLLPMAAIWETGNHIAKLDNGGLRYQYGIKLLEDVTKALQGEAPYRPIHFPDREEFLSWLRDFPQYVQRNKSATKTQEGISLSDLSIIKEWERTKARHNMSRVLIWSLDSDLAGHDTGR
jgi:hypothetical protein